MGIMQDNLCHPYYTKSTTILSDVDFQALLAVQHIYPFWSGRDGPLKEVSDHILIFSTSWVEFYYTKTQGNGLLFLFKLPQL